jgi:hypothetical protein
MTIAGIYDSSLPLFSARRRCFKRRHTRLNVLDLDGLRRMTHRAFGRRTRMDAGVFASIIVFNWARPLRRLPAGAA